MVITMQAQTTHILSKYIIVVLLSGFVCAVKRGDIVMEMCVVRNGIYSTRRASCKQHLRAQKKVKLVFVDYFFYVDDHEHNLFTRICYGFRNNVWRKMPPDSKKQTVGRRQSVAAHQFQEICLYIPESCLVCNSI